MVRSSDNQFKSKVPVLQLNSRISSSDTGKGVNETVHVEIVFPRSV